MTVRELFIAWQEWETDTPVELHTAGMDDIELIPWACNVLKQFGSKEVVSFGFKDSNRGNPIVISIEE